MHEGSLAHNSNNNLPPMRTCLYEEYEEMGHPHQNVDLAWKKQIKGWPCHEEIVLVMSGEERPIIHSRQLLATMGLA